MVYVRHKWKGTGVGWGMGEREGGRGGEILTENMPAKRGKEGEGYGSHGEDASEEGERRADGQDVPGAALILPALCLKPAQTLVKIMHSPNVATHRKGKLQGPVPTWPSPAHNRWVASEGTQP